MKRYFLKSLTLCLILGLSLTFAACNNSTTENSIQEDEELDKYERIIDPETEEDLNEINRPIDINHIP